MTCEMFYTLIYFSIKSRHIAEKLCISKDETYFNGCEHKTNESKAVPYIENMLDVFEVIVIGWRKLVPLTH